MFQYFLNSNKNTAANQKKLSAIKGLAKQQRISGDIHVYSSRQELKDLVVINTTKVNQSLVSIGDEHDFHQLFNSSAGEANVFGHIPLTAHEVINKLLGITSYKEATVAIAQRKIASYEPIVVSNFKILTQCSLVMHSAKKIAIQFDNNLTIHTPATRLVVINNLLQPNETKAIELQIMYSESATTNSSAQRDDKIELPHQKNILRRQAAISDEKLIVHMKADDITINSEDPIINTYFTGPIHNFAIKRFGTSNSFITKKHANNPKA